MKVEVWSDIVCPFCYIGKRKFEAALEQFEHKNDVELIFKSFELDPNAKVGSTQKTNEMLAAKYGMSLEQAKATSSQVAEQARAVGLAFDFERAIITNTKDAHRLIHFAKETGKMKEVKEKLLQAHFTDGLDVGDHAVLAHLAQEAGVDRAEAQKVLAEGAYSDAVAQDELEAKQLGIQGVPFFVFNRKYAVSGAQDPEQFLNVLKKVWEEEHGQPILKMMNEPAQDGDADDSCKDGSCGI